jgi:hypothetical protein
MAPHSAKVGWLSARRGAFVVLLLARAAAADEVVKTYQDPAFDATVRKILVVGVHADGSTRSQFENSVARAVRAAGGNAEPSLYRMTAGQQLTADTLTAAARGADADAVSVTRVVAVETQNPEAATSFNEHFRSYDGYADPLAEATTHTVAVRTDLYLVATQQRVWGVESTAVEKRTLFGVIDAIATATAAQLQSDGLID